MGLVNIMNGNTKHKLAGRPRPKLWGYEKKLKRTRVLSTDPQVSMVPRTRPPGGLNIWWSTFLARETGFWLSKGGLVHSGVARTIPLG